MKLLIINDLEPTLNFLEQAVSWDEYGITAFFSADSAEAARVAMQDMAFDIILCDIQMPGESGLEFIRWAHESGYECDCIFLTCHASFEFAKEAIQLGCQDYILFPAPANEIGLAVQKVASRRKDRLEIDRLKQFGQIWLDEKRSRSSCESSSSKTPRDLVDDIVRYIVENISDPELNAFALSQKSCLSLSYFSRLFKKTTGTTVTLFIIRERMERAAKLLASTHSSINSIALEVGYENYPYFTSAFKKYYGTTPTQYRNAHNAPQAGAEG